jgi:hypothetical protein
MEVHLCRSRVNFYCIEAALVAAANATIKNATIIATPLPNSMISLNRSDFITSSLLSNSIPGMPHPHSELLRSFRRQQLDDGMQIPNNRCHVYSIHRRRERPTMRYAS